MREVRGEAEGEGEEEEGEGRGRGRRSNRGRRRGAGGGGRLKGKRFFLVLSTKCCMYPTYIPRKRNGNKVAYQPFKNVLIHRTHSCQLKY
jgi:hypothetical protein